MLPRAAARGPRKPPACSAQLPARPKAGSHAALDSVPRYGRYTPPMVAATSSPAFTIGQLAQRCGVSVETVRFYEREGLLAQPKRPARGYRRYPASDVDRVSFLQRAKALGFSLREIGELLILREAATTCRPVRERAEAKIETITARIDALLALRTELERLVAACDRDATIDECPILRALLPEEHQQKEEAHGQ